MSRPFGYVYDPRMLLHDCGYDKTMAENPQRIRLIHERLQQDGLLNAEKAIKIEAREASDEELMLNHPKALIDEIAALNNDKLCEEYCKDKEILWTCENTLEAARVASGATIEIVKAAIENRIDNGFAIIRPPGHHSYGKTPRGYCIFNNAVIGAKYALEYLGIKKVAIVDFDYHAGNGTYESVKNDNRIHLTSIHAHHHGAFWPFTREFDYATCNPHTLFVPLNGSMNTEADYLGIFHHVVLPQLRQIKPELIIISAGFDAGYFDIMGPVGQGVKAHGYGHMARLLAEVCPGKTIAVLEGGYFPKNYTESASMLVRGLQGLELPRIEFPKRLSGALVETLWNVLYHHQEWYPELKTKLDKLIEQQKVLKLKEFVPDQILFFGDRMRKIYDDMIKHGICRTKEWFPEVSAEQEKDMNSKIDKYISEYKFSANHDLPNEQQLLAQLVWDEQTRSDAFIQSAPFTTALITEYNAFVDGKIDNMMICDRELVRNAVQNGSFDKHEKYEHPF
ncbi:unnamed protein product [Caenorhabditis angaria]|uniref:Histone deacetylase domain-containing protein n=1 Tax=Caenorhabditis angaria TaxID=860376 RepID=A0A9P1MV03_9PELO|nr:unnamed protein product [Caenorhabditis angaria]